jgi:D-aspartate ligase
MTRGASRTPAAVVIGLDSITGLQTARTLARHRIRVVGVARNSAHPSCRTNACTRIVFTETAGDELAERLLKLGSSFEEPPVLFPCTDLSVLSISQHRDELASAYRSVLPARGVIERLLDKAQFQAYATDAGLPVAQTRVLHDRLDALAAAETLRFPCVLKPAVKTSRWHSHTSAKVFRVVTPAELLHRYDGCCGWTDLLIAQEWIDGPDTRHVTCNAYFASGSRPHLTFVSQKLRQWPLEGGVGCLSQECRNDEVANQTIRVFQGVQHRGLAYLEMKQDTRSDRYLIIEPNVGRPTGRSGAADAAGIELLYTQYCDALDRPLPTPRAQRYGNAKWIYLRQDVQSAVEHIRRRTLTPVGYLRSLRGLRRDAIFSWRDPAPFLADLSVAARKSLPPSRHDALHREDSDSSEDFDLHGVVGIRLVGASPADVAAVTRQVGPVRRTLNREPDIVVRFVDELPVHELQWLEYGRTGYTADGFYVLQDGKRPARAKVPLAQVGGTCQIVCQRGLGPVPLLMAIVNLTALGRGCLPLHASAFVHRGAGVLVTGWAKGGKTGSLLAFGAEGAEFVGDDWILLTSEGRLLGTPQAMRVQGWHLDQLPQLCRTEAGTRRVRLESIRHLDLLSRRLAASPLRRLLPNVVVRTVSRLRRRLTALVDPVRAMEVRPDRAAAFLDTVFYMVSHDAPTTSVEPADAGDIAARMAAASCYEQLPLMSAYLAYRSGFPGRRNEFLDSADAMQTAMLTRALTSKAAYVVRHPYPCDLRALYQAMAPLCVSPSVPPPPDLSIRRTAGIALPEVSHG